MPLATAVSCRSATASSSDYVRAVLEQRETHLRHAYVALRRKGARLSAAWGGGETELESILAAFERAQSRARDHLHEIDAIELCVAHSFQELDLAGHRGRLTNVHRGIRGLELSRGDRTWLWGPSEMIARNLSFPRLLERFCEEQALDEARFAAQVSARIFEAEQVLIQTGPSLRATQMTRGAKVLAPEEVTRRRVEAFAEGLRQWMLNHVDDRGRMTYKYWPSRGRESSANNMLRQWMATLCLVRLARADVGLVAVARRNLEYNLEHSFRARGALGIIDCDGKVKLGAVALAALAIVEHRDRSAYRDVERRLRRTVDDLWNDDGSFRTFLVPEGRTDNQNFYPGEALLLWATLYDESGDDELLTRIKTSFDYYRRWHLEHKNPAFIPWHTQAYFLLWRRTGDPELRDFVLSMNDWLLGIQQWDDALYPDVRGQFYDPRHPEYGPPHASSTGVYLEGLADAYAMTTELGDRDRAERYRVGITRGLRSVMQLQFDDDVDMFYISKRDRVRGGLRTTVYDNTVRVDNVQHNLMAALKVLDRFGERDFRPSSEEP